jgi:predicted Zn finger-like uncharacterized protein
MFTVCPKCALTLVVSAGDLRVAQGYVRCGRCSNVFNAIVGLSDDRQKAAAQAAINAPAPQRQTPAAAAPPPPPPPPPPQPQPEPEIEIETEDDTASTGENEALYAEPEPLDVLPESALEFDPSSTDVSKVFIAGESNDERSGTFETIVLRADEEESLELVEDEALVEEEEEAAPEEAPENEYVDNDLRSLAARIDAETAAAPKPAPRPAPPRTGAGQPPPRFVSESEQGVEARAAATQTLAARQSARAAAAVAESLAPPAKPAPNAMTYVWPAAAVFALLLLGVQVVHHYRHDLATDPRFNRTLTSLYAKLGVALVPRWDLTSYEVRQLGASSGADTRGQLLVRASLKNAASHSLPLPLLRVIVQDRYGNRIASRDVAPRGYVPGAVPESALLGPGQRLDAEMVFVDPGQQAVGFEIDACLPSPEGQITCANDIIAAR